ncbi:hypothetical protein LUTEI9C_50235 [Luteimonas sp. 9C]|nr:hypothetical protein LUTEI9C_50235 [Luteimonas sp. 9C]
MMATLRWASSLRPGRLRCAASRWYRSGKLAGDVRGIHRASRVRVPLLSVPLSGCLS